MALALMASGAAVLTWIDLLGRVVVPSMVAGLYPTSAYWVAPRLVLQGRSSLLYDVRVFPEAARVLGGNGDVWVSDPPMSVLQLLPLGALSQDVAFSAWTLGSLAALVAAVVLALRALSVPSPWSLVVFAVLPLFHPVQSDFATGQIYHYLLLALVGSEAAWLRDRPWVSGFAVAAATLVKFFFGAVASGTALLLGRTRVFVVAALALLSVAALVTFLLGPERWSEWIAVAAQRSTGGESTVTAYQTLNSLFGHLLRYDAVWNPEPVANVPAAAAALWAASVIGIAVVTAIAARGVRDLGTLLPLALLMPATLLVAPVAEDQHFVLLIPSLLIATALLWRDNRTARLGWIALAAAIALLAPAWPYNRQGVEGWSTLLFYPRVYGTLTLWGLVTWLALHGSRAEPQRVGS
ncbi:MAG TPA: glycosyltransferase family 87 protein [Candidatus Limnocylindria bacterium]|nr:glycosyltransferase family 87 protein [Candidatus Limnocylindria bacterium]